MRTIPGIGRYPVFENPIFTKCNTWPLIGSESYNRFYQLFFSGFYTNENLVNKRFKFHHWDTVITTRQGKITCELRLYTSFKNDSEDILRNTDIKSFLDEFVIKEWDQLEAYNHDFPDNIRESYYRNILSHKPCGNILNSFGYWGIAKHSLAPIAEISNYIFEVGQEPPSIESIINFPWAHKFGVYINFQLSTSDSTYDFLLKNSIFSLAFGQVAESANGIAMSVIGTMVDSIAHFHRG